MAHKAVAAKWLLDKKFLKTAFTEFSWGKPNYYDVGLTIEDNNGIIFSGRGTDKNDDVALEKATAEAIERWCCHKLSISTVGCAVHYLSTEAEKKSKEEFVERFILKSLLEEGSPKHFQEIDFTPNMLNKTFCNFRSWILPLKDFGVFTMVCFFDNEKPISIGMFFGKLTSNLAIEKAYIEAARNYAAFKNDPIKFQKTAIADKNLWCCDHNYLEQLLFMIKKQSHSLELLNNFPMTHTTTKKVAEILNFNDCPLLFCHTELLNG